MYVHSEGGCSATHAAGTSAHLGGSSADLYIWWMILGTAFAAASAGALDGAAGAHNARCSRTASSPQNSRCSTSSCNATAATAKRRILPAMQGSARARRSGRLLVLESLGMRRWALDLPGEVSVLPLLQKARERLGSEEMATTCSLTDWMSHMDDVGEGL